MKHTAQPARRNYFFGKGFYDIRTAIKYAWERNVLSAKKHYDKYHEKGPTHILGLVHLFASISNFVFAIPLIGAIGLLLALFVSFIFTLISLVCFIVWLIDRTYLMRNKIFTACVECKNKSLIPTYVCPNCGVHHTNLMPSGYGIFRRRCNCGKSLPTAFFNGRKKLQSVCPHCLQSGTFTHLNEGESRPFCVPVVGGRSVGKTAYITAFSQKFIASVAPSKHLDIAYFNDEKEQIYKEIQADYAAGSTRMTARSLDVTKPSSISFSFFVRNKALKPDRLVHIYDIAGEVFTDNNENEIQRQYEYCHGIVFIVDPFAIPSVRSRYESTLSPKDLAGIGKADISGVLNVFFNKLREVTGYSEQKMSKVPIAIVISKSDSSTLQSEFAQPKFRELEYVGDDAHVYPSDAMNFLCREFFLNHDMADFLQAIDMKFIDKRFFVASAIGHTRDAGTYEPSGVLEPMEWICSKADKGFALTWVTGRYSDRQVKRKTSGS